jgi:outer membrane protein assembly factor BamB
VTRSRGIVGWTAARDSRSWPASARSLFALADLAVREALGRLRREALEPEEFDRQSGTICLLGIGAGAGASTAFSAALLEDITDLAINSGHPRVRGVHLCQRDFCRQRWVYRARGLTAFTALAYGAKTVIIIDQDGRVRGLNNLTGQPRWVRELGNTDHARSPDPPVSDGATAYVRLTDGLHAMDANTGRMRWTDPSPPPGTPLAADDGVVYLAAGDGLISAASG